MSGNREVRGRRAAQGPGRAVAWPTNQSRRPPSAPEGNRAGAADPAPLLRADARLFTATGLTSWPSSAGRGWADPDSAGRRGHGNPASQPLVPTSAQVGRRQSASLSREAPHTYTHAHTPLKAPPYRRAGRRARTAGGAAGRMDRRGWAGGFERLPPRTGRTGGGARTGRV